MSALDDAQAATRRHQAECRALEAALAAIRLPRVVDVPGFTRPTVDGRVAIETFGVDRDRYNLANELGRVLFRRDVFAARASYLRERWETLQARADRQQETRQRAAAGLDRFLPGRFGLDLIVETNRTTAAARDELRRQRDARQAAEIAAELEARAAEKGNGTP